MAQNIPKSRHDVVYTLPTCFKNPNYGLYSVGESI